MLSSVSDMWPQWLLLTAIPLLCFFRLSTKSKTLNPPLPPGPGGLPGLGYIPFLGTNLHRKFTDLATVYGPIFKLRLGSKLYVVISSPSLIKQALRDHDTILANRDSTIAGTIITYDNTDIVSSSHGPYWRKMRKIFVSQMMCNSSLDGCYHLRRQEVRSSVRNVYEKIGAPVDVGELAFGTSVSAVVNMVVSGSNLAGDFRDVVAELVVVVGMINVSDLLPVLARFDIQGIARKARKVAERFEELLDLIIEQRVGSGGEGEGTPKDFLQLVLELRDSEDDSASITDAQLKSLLQDIIIGSTETVATTIEWAMTELLKNPNIMARVQEELTQVVGLNNTVEELHFPNLPYLDAVIKETLRLHPSLPLLVPHCPSEPCVVGGYTIPQGTLVFLNVWAIHTDPRVWDEPLEFKPERFLNGGDYSGNDFRFIPFGSGRRICAGMPLAERMLFHILASFLHSFEWGLPDGSELDVSDKFGIVLKKKVSLVAVPMPRLSEVSCLGPS